MSLTENELKTLSVLLDRMKLAGRAGTSHQGKRDYYKVFGWKPHGELKFEDYYWKFKRQGLARRIIKAAPKETWRVNPKIREDNDNDSNTAFENDWQELLENVKVWNYMKRADILSGIGRYGILLIGVKGETKWDEPLEDGSLNGPGDILYLSPLHEDNAEINTLITDTNNPDYGKPETYKVDMLGDVETTGDTDLQIVHHSRVLHLAENKLENEVYGTPRLQKVYNRLDDLYKLVGGAAEMFWKSAYGGKQLNVNPDFDFDSDDLEDLESKLEEYEHGLRRIIQTVGAEVNNIDGDVVEPGDNFDNQISLISAAIGIPKRILTGSERGELASSQDERNWLSEVEERQTNYVTDEIVRPFVDWCIAKDAISEPKDGYKVEWPSLFQSDEEQEANILSNISTSVKNMAPAGSPEMLVEPDMVKKIIEEYTRVEFNKKSNVVGNELEELNEDEKEIVQYFKSLKENS